MTVELTGLQYFKDHKNKYSCPNSEVQCVAKENRPARRGAHPARHRCPRTASRPMNWLFVRAVCLKIDECSVVSIMPVRQHKCRSVTLKGLSNETWFNLSFFSLSLLVQHARALHYSSSSGKWIHFLYNFFSSKRVEGWLFTNDPALVKRS